jgi:hypothetical protein
LSFRDRDLEIFFPFHSREPRKKNLERIHIRRLTPNRGGVQPDRGEVRLRAAGSAQVLPQPGRQSILRLSQGGQEL